MKYTLIRLTQQGFIEHKNITSTHASEGKISATVSGELYAYVDPSADLEKTKAIMLNTAIGAAQARVLAAQADIERLRSLKGGAQ
jgi:hypothetical protein